MSEDNRKVIVPDAIEQIFASITPELQPDGQYVPVGFPSQQDIGEAPNWGAQAVAGSYNLNYGLQYQEQLSYMHPRQDMYDSMLYQKNLTDFNHYTLRSNSAPQSVFNYPQALPEHHNTSSANEIFGNLMGNWAMSNTTGTYSPFGNTDTFKPSVVLNLHTQSEDDIKIKPLDGLIDDKFNFNKDMRKSRPLAEVKPMRPSYSDVLTKPVPTTNVKPAKAESKDFKVKKDSRKNGRIDKAMKAANVLNRSNTNNDIKDIPTEKPLSSSKSDKKPTKLHQLNRKWASLDDITEPISLKNDEKKSKKQEEILTVGSKPINKPKNKVNKPVNNNCDEVSDDNNKVETVTIGKNVIKKTNSKSNSRQRQSDGHASGTERVSSKRNAKGKKKQSQQILDLVGEKFKLYTKGWWRVIMVFALWLFHLISDVFSLSIHLGHDFLINSSIYVLNLWTSFVGTSEMILKRWRLSAWVWAKIECKFKHKSKKTKLEDDTNSFLQNGLETNISMPTTGDEAMKRLLACKGKDPYSILGVTPKCSDDDIKKYYKRQAFLVHPDKNNQPGAEEAFKILVHAFDMIGTPERRTTYDRGVAESAFVVQNFSQMAELLQKLQQKMEMNANTIRCVACGDRHKRMKVDRPSYAARNCKTCKIHHSAREGDIWAEAKCLGILWHYYACMEGSVYDITDWAGCQKDSLKHLKPDSHNVQYRIALGKQNNQTRVNSGQTPRMEKPDLEHLLNSLYGNNENGISKRKSKTKK